MGGEQLIFVTTVSGGMGESQKMALTVDSRRLHHLMRSFLTLRTFLVTG